jgi:hypothetical protein
MLHHRIEVATGLQISDPHAPWQRGSNKSANIGQAPQLDRRLQHRAIRYGALLHAGGYQGRALMAVDVDHGYLLGVTRAGPASPS